MQKASPIFIAGSAIAFSLCSIVSAHAQTAPANTRPGGINCTIRNTLMSPGDIAFAHNDFTRAIDLYRAESKAAGPEGSRTHAALVRAMLRADKVQEAAADVHSWTSAAPKDAWAKVALGEVQWRQGNITDALSTMQSAIQSDFCNPQAHAAYAHVLRLTGLPASAQTQLSIARRLDPIDSTIELEWLQLQPRPTQAAELNNYLQRSTFLTDNERKSLEERKTHLSQAAIPSCRATSSTTSTQLPLKPVQAGPQSPASWGIEVYFNGRLRRLEVDTGASGLQLTQGAANAMHLDFDAAHKTHSPADNLDTFPATVKTIKIGDLQFEDCEIRVLEKTPSSMEGKDGIIGTDVFRAFLTTLDFPGRLFKLDPTPTAPNTTADTTALYTAADSIEPLHDRYIDTSLTSWTKMIRSGSDILIPARINGGPIRFFVVDTSGADSAISTEAAKGVTKVVDSRSGVLRGPIKLEFSGVAYPTPAMTALDTIPQGRSTGLEIGGVLGATILHQLTIRIDYRDDLINFTFDHKRITGCVPGVVKVDCY